MQLAELVSMLKFKGEDNTEVDNICITTSNSIVKDVLGGALCCSITCEVSRAYTYGYQKRRP